MCPKFVKKIQKRKNRLRRKSCQKKSKKNTAPAPVLWPAPPLSNFPKAKFSNSWVRIWSWDEEGPKIRDYGNFFYSKIFEKIFFPKNIWKKSKKNRVFEKNIIFFLNIFE